MKIFDLGSTNFYQKTLTQEKQKFKFSFIDLLVLLGSFDNRIVIIFLLYFSDKTFRDLITLFEDLNIPITTLNNDLGVLEEYGLISTCIQPNEQIDVNGIVRLRNTRFYTILNDRDNAQFIIIACLTYLLQKTRCPNILKIFKQHSSKFVKRDNRKSINSIRFEILKLIYEESDGTSRGDLRYSSEWYRITAIQFDTLIRNLIEFDIIYENDVKGDKLYFFNDELRGEFETFMNILDEPLSNLGIRYSLDIDFSNIILSILKQTSSMEYVEA